MERWVREGGRWSMGLLKSVDKVRCVRVEGRLSMGRLNRCPNSSQRREGGRLSMELLKASEVNGGSARIRKDNEEGRWSTIWEKPIMDKWVREGGR
jgi:hypothetical protein